MEPSELVLHGMAWPRAWCQGRVAKLVRFEWKGAAAASAASLSGGFSITAASLNAELLQFVSSSGNAADGGHCRSVGFALLMLASTALGRARTDIWWRWLSVAVQLVVATTVQAQVRGCAAAGRTAAVTIEKAARRVRCSKSVGVCSIIS